MIYAAENAEAHDTCLDSVLPGTATWHSIRAESFIIRYLALSFRGRDLAKRLARLREIVVFGIVLIRETRSPDLSVNYCVE